MELKMQEACKTSYEVERGAAGAYRRLDREVTDQSRKMTEHHRYAIWCETAHY